MTEFLHRQNFSLIIISYTAIGLALFTNLMPLTIMLGAACVIWRSANYYGLIRLPSSLVLVFVSLIFTVLIIYWQYKQGLFSVLVNLIMLAFSLKFLELKSTRDVHVYVCTALFLVAIYFIYYQSAFLVSIGFVLVFLILFVLISTHATALSYLAQFKQLIITSLMSLPLAIVLFMVIPRLPAFWSMPSQNSAETGLSDSVNLGDIAELSRSRELAFRASFSGEVPAQEQRYWRMMTLDQYDGQTWSQSKLLQEEENTAFKDFNEVSDKLNNDLLKNTASNNTPLTNTKNFYQVLIEGHNKQWLPALDYVAIDAPMGGDMVRLNDFSLRYIKPIVNQQLFTIKQTQNIPTTQLSKNELSHFIKLPDKSFNLQTRLWLEEQLKEDISAQQILDQLLIRFMQQEYYYTLKPAKLGRNQIDDFLFTNMAGFCVHYASSFIYVARSLGIPARMVTGYFGGEWDAQSKLMTIRQYDAHAWAEIWRNGRWIRVDPTAYISADRVENGLLSTQSDVDLILNNMLSIDALGLAFEKLNFVWSTWVVNLDSEKQLDFLQRLVNKYKWLNIFYAVFLLLLGAFLLMVLFVFKPWKKTHIATEDKYYRKLQAHYKHLGIQKFPGQTVSDYCLKVGQKNKKTAINVKKFASIYNRIKYQTHVAEQDRQQQIQELALIIKLIVKSK